jgi:hypothetical protein
VATDHAGARLEDPNQEVATYRRFTPDGTRLFTTSRQSESIHAWDLRLIRRRLAELDLDQQRPDYLLEDLYFPAMSHHRAGDPAKARAAFDQAVEVHGNLGLTPPRIAEMNAYRAEAERTLAK